jgi:ribonucleotide reductase alpha subunit
MFVTKRNNKVEEVNFDKVHTRIKHLVKKPYLLHNINAPKLTQHVIQGLFNNMKTSEIDNYTANIASSLSVQHKDYAVLAGRIVINNCHKNTLTSFKDKVELLYNRKNDNNVIDPIVSDYFYKFVQINHIIIEKYINYENDYKFDYFGFRTLEKGYLLKVNNVLVERPQDMFMRVAIFIHMNLDKFDCSDAMNKILETYKLLSDKYFTHASPTLFNAGTVKPQLASCYLLGTDDSLEGIMKTASDCATISKWSGGIGFHFSNWRSAGSLISGTNGVSSGAIPFLRIFNDIARAFNQGGKRNGSFAGYIEPHHPDILDFLSLRRNHGDENMRARDLFLALWISDLFMTRVKTSGKWSVFSSSTCPGLTDVYGDEYTKLYEKYEAEGKAYHTYEARDIWSAIYTSQKESGIPYMIYKDRVNKLSNQKNIGTIKSSNLCVSGDTDCLTINGYKNIKFLANNNWGSHMIWNGNTFTKAQFAKTSDMANVLLVTTKCGYKLKCTPFHKFYINDENNKSIMITAENLTPGLKLLKWELPLINDYYKLDADSNIRMVTINQTIESITLLTTQEETYCLNEPIRHMAVFNGILTGQCSEIMEYSDSKEYAVCTLSSICLPEFVFDEYSQQDLLLDISNRRVLNNEFPKNPVFDYKKLSSIVCVITQNLNNVIDRNWYPLPETKLSNLKNRPIGIGVQGLADVFYKFRYSFDSIEAKSINKKIFETIYYAALSKSSQIAKELYFLNKTPGEVLDKTLGAYESYKHGEGSPLSHGIFHWEAAGLDKSQLSGMFDWETLRNHILTFGVRNSLLVALMPTASTSQIMGNNEAFEPMTSNIYKRKTLAGEFIVINKYLMHDLDMLGVWSKNVENYLKVNNGSIQNIEGIPDSIKSLYKTVWEMSQKTLIDLSADRTPFVDQSQSLNLFVEDLTYDKFTSMHFYGWSKGLKTGSYYIRTRPSIEPQKFTVNPDDQKKAEFKINTSGKSDTMPEPDEICLLCSS